MRNNVLLRYFVKVAISDFYKILNATLRCTRDCSKGIVLLKRRGRGIKMLSMAIYIYIVAAQKEGPMGPSHGLLQCIFNGENKGTHTFILPIDHT